jgi:hypothetical protein
MAFCRWQVRIRERGHRFQSCMGKAAAYAPRFPDFLKNRATTVEVLDEGEAKATATYVDGETVQQAIRQAGPTP